MKTIKIIVGTMTLTESKTVVEYGETASYEKHVRVDPGTYPVVAHCRYEDGQPSIGHSLYIQFEGTIVGGYMASRGFGYTGPNEMARRVGEKTRISEAIDFSYITDARPTAHTVTLRDYSGIDRDVEWPTVPMESLRLPVGLQLDTTKLFVWFAYDVTYTDGSVQKRARVQIRRDAYNRARDAA